MALKRPAGDRELALLVMERGDEAAFRELYRRHTPYLYQFALRTLGGNEHDADDVVQEMWIRAVEKFRQFRWESGLRTWLSGIAINLCRGLFRRRDRYWIEVRDDMLEISSDYESRMDLETAIGELPDGYRAVLVLHDVEGFRHEEIARMLGVTPGTSKSQLFHARRAVRKMLGDKLREQEARLDENGT